jgi:hypothetical protein
MKVSSRFRFKLDIFHPDYNPGENRKIRISEKKNIRIRIEALTCATLTLFINKQVNIKHVGELSFFQFDLYMGNETETS